MQGIIIINPFGVKQTVSQAERMTEEFNKLGVKTETVTDGWTKTAISSGKLFTRLKNADFVLFLDKDKYLSGTIEKSGVRLFNRHEAIRVCDDKGETYLALSGAGLNIPETVFAPLCYRENSPISEVDAVFLIEKLSIPMIVKESYGSLGLGVYLVKDKKELLSLMDSLKMKPHLYQEYLPYKFGTDVRVIVIGGKVVASMERHNDNDFRSNVAQGGVGRNITLSEEFKKVAEKCAEVLRLDYCGVDLLYGKNGEPYVCEVNSNAFFDGIEKVTGVNVAKSYAEYIVNQIKG